MQLRLDESHRVKLNQIQFQTKMQLPIDESQEVE